MIFLVFSVVCSLCLGHYEDEASHTGLAVTACRMAIIDIAFGVYVMYCACCICSVNFHNLLDRFRRRSVALLVRTLRYWAANGYVFDLRCGLAMLKTLQRRVSVALP